MIVQRRNAAYLDPLERRLLAWLADRLPTAMTPDMLTWLGFCGALCAAGGYALAARYPAMLWLATAGIIVNWFGDSLDGTLARRRRIERPRYGFFLDNSIDIVEQALLAVGLGLSGYVTWDLAAAVLVTFFMISMLSLFQALVSKVFNIAYGGVGLTEIRCALVAWNVALFWFPPRPFEVFGVSLTYPNLLAIVWLSGNVISFAVIMTRQLRQLAIEDPPRERDAVPRSSDRIGEPLGRT